MRTRGLAIVGTGTGVGKTVVTAAIGVALRRKGRRVAAWKPVATGGLPREGRFVSIDAVRLARAVGMRPEDAGGFCWRHPLAPAVAARLEGRPLRIGALLRAWRARRTPGRIELVEGVGGVLVPLRGAWMVADLVKALRLPALVVAPAGLGTINHTLLTLEALRSRGIRIVGVILNAGEGGGLAERTNPGVIRSLGRTRVIAVLPRVRRVWSKSGGLNRLAARIPVKAILKAVKAR